MKKLAAALLMAALALALALPGQAAMNKYSVVFMDTFDTVISLIGFAPDQETFDACAEDVHAAYQKMHQLFDTYNEYEGVVSIRTLNERAAEGPVAVDPILFDLLDFCKQQYALGQGQVNIAMGSVLSIWHDYREAGMDDPAAAALPPMAELEAAAAHTSIDDLVLDRDAMTVYFADPQLKLDVGAVAKGYATERVADMLLEGDMPSFIISAGGNVRLGNPPEDGRAAWGVGIQDPNGSVLGLSDIVETLFLANRSVVTSGDYQRYYVVDGESYNHLIDPDTLMPGRFYRSVSILTEDSGYADMLSTAAFLMPYEESRAFIESLDGVEALWVFEDEAGQMTVEMTEGAQSVAKSCGATNAKP